MSYIKCVEKYQKYFQIDDFTEDDIAEKSKRGTINKKPNAKIFEIREVEQLNPDITTASKSSGITEKLNQKRKERHDALMKKLAEDLNEINVKTEENIRISSEEVKAHMKTYKDRLSDKLKSLDRPEVASYHETVFLDIQKEANTMKTHQLQLVEDLYEDLKKFENDRSAENERIFQLSFKDIEKTAYILPYELQSFIEHEALKMNQLSLNNRRCYEDLKLKLTLVTEQTFKSFMDEVFCLKDKWVRCNKQADLDNRYLSCYKTEEKPPVPPLPQTRLELKRHMLSVKLTADGFFSIADVEDWFWNINDVSSALETITNMLVDLHRQVINAVEKGMRNDYDELRKSLLSLDDALFEERTIQPIQFESSTLAEENIEELELYWQYILWDVKGKLEETFDCLAKFGELWSRHFDRLCESKVLVLKAVEKAEENNIPPLQELEVKVNLSLDALRQEYNEAKLESLYTTAVANLDSIKEKLELDYINEVTIIENYYKMMNLEADVLSSEINEFIYLKLSEVPENEEKSLEMKTKLDEPRMEVGELYKKTEELMENAALTFSKSELKNALKNFANNTRERVAWRAEEWVNIRVQEIARKYQTQLEMLHKRYDRIRSQIYEVRQQEIYVHEKVFDEHKAGVEEIYKKLTQTTENFYQKSMEKLEDCRINVASIVADATKENRASSVRCIQTKMQKQKAEFMAEVAMKAEQSLQEIEFRVSSVQHSNLKFMKSIKLFHENGNYDVDEAKTYITSLENIDKESSNEAKSATRELRKKETELLQKTSDVFDEAIRALMQLDEELQFYASVKNVYHLCKSDFQELSAGFKDDFDSLNKYCDFIRVCTAEETTFLSHEEDRYWFLLITALYNNICNLFYTLEVPQWSENPVEEAKGNEPEKTKVQETQVGKGKDTKSDYPCKDFREGIFEESLLTENTTTFMNAICKKCWDYMDNLQRLGYAFYKNLGSKSLIRKDLLKLNYEAFGNDTCQIFRSFALQCEALWLQMMRGFLPVLGNVKMLFKTYFERKVREYAQDIISTLNNHDVEYTHYFNENSCHMLSELQNLDNKLLPLHGCPRNSHLLSSLEDEVVSKTAELELGWEVFTKKYEIKLKSIRKLCTSENEEYQALKRFYTECKDSVFVEKLGKSLLDFIDTIINRRGFVKKMGKTGLKIHSDGEALLPYADMRYNTERGEAPQVDKPWLRHKLKLHHLEGGLEDADTYFAEIRQIIRRETTDIHFQAEDSSANHLEPKLGLLTDAEEFEDIIAPHMKKIKNFYHEIKDFIRSKKNFHEEVVFEWLDKWKGNLEKNLELYTVKYPHVDDA